MRAILAGHLTNIGITLRPIAVLVFMLVLLCTTALIVIRQQCVHKGYEISRMSSIMEEKNLEYERLSSNYYNVLRSEALFDKAIAAGFTFPKGGRVFYVQR